jgi:hypothetical protein
MLVVRLLAIAQATLYVPIQSSPKNNKWATSQRCGQHTLDRQKDYSKKLNKKGWKEKRF